MTILGFNFGSPVMSAFSFLNCSVTDFKSHFFSVTERAKIAFGKVVFSPLLSKDREIKFNATFISMGTEVALLGVGFWNIMTSRFYWPGVPFILCGALGAYFSWKSYIFEDACQKLERENEILKSQLGGSQKDNQNLHQEAERLKGECIQATTSLMQLQEEQNALLRAREQEAEKDENKLDAISQSFCVVEQGVADLSQMFAVVKQLQAKAKVLAEIQNMVSFVDSSSSVTEQIQLLVSHYQSFLIR